MSRTRSLQRLCAAAFLIALGIIIPMFSPFKILLEPASFTLASHVPTLMAMFISPAIAAAVAAGTALGFFFGGFPLVVVLRAATHVIFAGLGAMYLSARPAVLRSVFKTQAFSLVLGLVHAAGELAVVAAFYAGGGMSAAYYDAGFVTSVLLLVGLGTVAHSMVDFIIALLVVKVVGRQPTLRGMLPIYAASLVRPQPAAEAAWQDS